MQKDNDILDDFSEEEEIKMNGTYYQLLLGGFIGATAFFSLLALMFAFIDKLSTISFGSFLLFYILPDVDISELIYFAIVLSSCFIAVYFSKISKQSLKNVLLSAFNFSLVCFSISVIFLSYMVERSIYSQIMDFLLINLLSIFIQFSSYCIFAFLIKKKLWSVLLIILGLFFILFI